ncbi:metallophosphoesterase family protein [Streptomyces sp. SID13666]|uniref:purple acid phosphatase family protein n=1 Tax=Streptomyces TaxID=1883 RepID=UPI001105890B|nr:MULTISPECIES: metallophosphoesterase family protein [unclassified Streptomyces]MCZ4098353.1 metallophosphoesterase family protein [Streptomyces sp. H39-C1]NEA57922.1 metallophosphoesterase family protein [Streptomyces sp. SID13666]NEA76342.1 metallophosphoesterase family protein [Streptomyces sp. SID13588]QNA75534.1 metallophosphoesterase family protein [Streptomyces sp. So13.3]
MDTPRMGIADKLADRMSMAEQHEYLRSRLTRRGVMRGTVAAAGAVAGAGLLSGTAAAASPTLLSKPATGHHVSGSLVAPFGRHLAFGADPKTQFRVSWQVPLAVKKPFIRVGLKPWALSHKIQAEVRALHTPQLLNSKLPPVDQYYLHAALDGLHPGTTYYYGVGHEGFDPAAGQAFGTIGTFTTAPARSGERFTFTAFGDQGVSYHALANDSLILAQNPAFHLHAGDICYADPAGSGQQSDSSVYDARTWDQFLAQTESVAARVPWMVTTGNHDMEAWYSPNGYGGQEARWSLPGNGPDAKNQPGAYSFVYGNTAVVALDANDVSYEIPANYDISAGKQTAWLDKRLGELRRQRGIDFIVVFFHHCAFSTTNSHASDGGVQEKWVPLFEKHQVDLVVNGHNHVYERTDAIRGGKVSKPVAIGDTVHPEKDGVVYVTAGGAGRSLYDFPAPDSYEGHEHNVDSVTTWHSAKGGGKVTETVAWSRVRYTGYSFIAVEVEPASSGRTSTLTVSALAETGERVDHFTVARKAR